MTSGYTAKWLYCRAIKSLIRPCLSKLKRRVIISHTITYFAKKSQNYYGENLCGRNWQYWGKLGHTWPSIVILDHYRPFADTFVFTWHSVSHMRKPNRSVQCWIELAIMGQIIEPINRTIKLTDVNYRHMVHYLELQILQCYLCGHASCHGFR
jgi:hypothetical protein